MNYEFLSISYFIPHISSLISHLFSLPSPLPLFQSSAPSVPFGPQWAIKIPVKNDNQIEDFCTIWFSEFFNLRKVKIIKKSKRIIKKEKRNNYPGGIYIFIFIMYMSIAYLISNTLYHFFTDFKRTQRNKKMRIGRLPNVY